MSSHASTSFLLAVIAVFVTTTAVSSDHIVSTPAKIAGHQNSSSSIALQNVVGTGSKLTDSNKTEIVGQCPHNSLSINETLYDGTNPAPKNYSDYYNAPVVKETMANTAWYNNLVLTLTTLSICSMVITVVVYRFSESLDHSRYIEPLTMSICASHSIVLCAKTVEQLIVSDFISTGRHINIKPTIVRGTIPGLVNIIAYVYLFQYKKIPISSIHPELISFYKKKIATRNLMFMLSVLMFTVDTLYILDITMEWNFNAIHVLHLLKSAQGLLISYIIFFRPFAPVFYSKLLKRLRQQEIANEIIPEETARPSYKVTSV